MNALRGALFLFTEFLSRAVGTNPAGPTNSGGATKPKDGPSSVSLYISDFSSNFFAEIIKIFCHLLSCNVIQ